MKRKVTSIMAFVLSGAVLLTSCSLVGGKKSKKSDLNEDIVEVVEDYFENLSSAKLDKAAKLVSDSSFADLELSSDEEDILEAYLGTLEFEVTEADGDEDDEEGSATVSLTFVDLEEIIDDLDDDASADDVIDAITAKKAPTTEEEVELDLVYDDDWMIDSDKDVYKTLLGSFEDLPVEAAEPTTTTTEEPTTTTTEEPTTTTTEEPTTTTQYSSDYYVETGRQLCPKHICDSDAFLKIINDLGMDVDDYSDAYSVYFEAALEDEVNDEYMVIVDYIHVDDPADLEDYMDDLDTYVFEYFEIYPEDVTHEEWYQNTHIIECDNMQYYDGNNARFVLYRDEDTFVLIIALTKTGVAFPSEYDKVLKESGM